MGEYREVSMKKGISKHLLLIPFAIVLLDQLAKFFVIQNLELGRYFVLIPKVLSITNISNSGVIFGLFLQNNNAIVIISLLFTCIICCWIFLVHKGKIKSQVLSFQSYIAFLLIIGGAISNIFDCIFRMIVVDYISLDFFNFPIFNIADIAITAGCAVLVWGIFKE